MTRAGRRAISEAQTKRWKAFRMARKAELNGHRKGRPPGLRAAKKLLAHMKDEFAMLEGMLR
jgi:hypothetical protein